MGTKRLSRTVLEAGRSRYGQWEQKYQKRRERAGLRLYNDRVCRAPEHAEEHLEPTRMPIGRCQRDTLGPIRRWLDSFVGQPWSTVLSKMVALADTRTLAGWHLIELHLKSEVRTSQNFDPWRGYLYFVDQRGTLQREPNYWARKRSRRLGHRQRLWREFVGVRKILEVGSKLYWCELVERQKAPRDGNASYRQTIALTKEERAFWKLASPEQRKQARYLPQGRQSTQASIAG